MKPLNLILTLCLCSQLALSPLYASDDEVHGQTLRDAAAVGDNETIRAALAAHPNTEASNRFGITALMRAAESGNAETVALLLSMGQMLMPVHEAAVVR